MKKGILLTIGFLALLIGFISLTAFTKAETSIVPAKSAPLLKQATDCSQTTWTGGITMDILYNPQTQYNSFKMNFTGTGPYVLEYSIWSNGPSYGFMGSGTIHNFSRNDYYTFPVSLPPGDYAIDFIIKNECGEELSDPQEFLFTNSDIE